MADSGLRALDVRNESGWRFALPALCVFIVAQALVRAHHEFWRDELTCWATGRAASGLSDLLTGERRYDGHPFLWYYVLHLASRVSPNPLSLHFVSGALAAVAAALWLRWAPVPRVLRLVLLGSYYVFYEYGVICRSYILGWALVCAFCALYHPLRIRYVWSGVILGLLSATSLYGTIVALALGGFVFSHGPLFEDVPEAAGGFKVTLRGSWLIGLAVFTAGLVVTAVTTMPPSDGVFSPGHRPDITWMVVDDSVGWYWKALFPFRGLQPWDWPKINYLGDGWRNGAAAPWLGAGWLAAWMFALRRRPRIAFIYASGVALISLAQYEIYFGGWRHIGHHFILQTTCVWLYARDTRDRAPGRLLYALFAINLVFQGITGFTAVRTDWTTPFSGAQETARYILDNHLEDLPVVAHTDATGAAVATILRKPFFYPVTGETNDSVIFHSRRGSPSEDEVLGHAARLARAAHGRALLILNYDNGARPIDGVEVRLLHQVGPTMVGDESFRVYDVEVAP
jgi:hypothetical protein